MDPSGLFQLPAQRFPELGDIVRREVESLLRSRDVASPSSQGPADCLYDTIEAYISLVLCLLPRLADRLATSSLITDYINTQVAKANDESDLSDMTPITLLCEKDRRLNSLVKKLQRVAEEFNNSAIAPRQLPPITIQPALQQLVSSYPASPPLSARAPSIASWLGATPPEISPYSLSGTPADSLGIFNEGHNAPAGMAYDMSASMDSPPTIPDFSDMVLEQPPTYTELVDASQLGQRGKGRHTCPHAFRCTKGGVNVDGTLVVFERNSIFRAHLQKHDRPFKCDLPGCTNRTGFARIDQLTRHKATTRHGQHNWHVASPKDAKF